MQMPTQADYAMVSPNNILDGDPQKRITIPTPLQYGRSLLGSRANG